jgi:antirestriction protein ArdC
MLERIQLADACFQSMGADVRHGATERITRPPTTISRCHRSKPSPRVSYYSTLAHEHAHWTAKSERCDRQLGKRFGDNAYAAEELIAELGAAIRFRASWTQHRTT